VDLSGTGDWHKYEWQRAASTITLPAGDIELRVAAIEVTNEAGAGNLRAIKLEHHAHE
jgi:phage baseplate assembly protein gpV